MSHSSQINKVIPPLTNCDHIRGSTNAAIILMEYGSYQCPQSGEAYFSIKDLQHQLVAGATSLEENPLCFVFRHFPRSQIYPQAQKAAEVAEAAAAQDKFWQMHDTLFEHQQALDDASLVEYAIQLNLDIPQFLQELADHIHAKRVEVDITSGHSNGVEETPTFFIGIRHKGAQKLKSILMAILESTVTERDDLS